jgi:23S rRNA pseudouridine2605 synthase
MRLNKYIAQATGMSRRAADTVIAEKRVRVDDVVGSLGQEVKQQDQVTLDGKKLLLLAEHVTILLNKPIGYVCSRDGQGSPTIYELLPQQYHHLKPVGRLDKDSSGLIVLTDDGELAQKLTHPSYQKEKVYKIELNKPLSPGDEANIQRGIRLDDGISHLKLKSLSKTGKIWQVTMHEGRNRQIRHTFAATGYRVTKLHREQFGPYKLADIPEKTTRKVT